MSEHLFTSITSIALSIVGLALVAVIISKNANTSGVLQSAGQALAADIGAAVSPVSGSGIASFGGFTNYGGGATVL